MRSKSGHQPYHDSKPESDTDLSTICHQKRNALSFPLPHISATLALGPRVLAGSALGHGNGSHEIAVGARISRLGLVRLRRAYTTPLASAIRAALEPLPWRHALIDRLEPSLPALRSL